MNRLLRASHCVYAAIHTSEERKTMIQEHPDNPERYRRTETMGGRETHEPRNVREHPDYTESRPGGSEGGFREAETREPAAYGEQRHEPRGYAEEEREPRGYRERPEYRARTEYEPDYEEEAPPEIKTVFGTSGINIIAGLWLLLAPFALGYAAVETALWNSVIIGLAVAVMAIVRVVRPDEYEGVSWVNFVLGIWLLISPFVLGLANIEWLVWNNIIVGIVVLALAATSAMATRRYHDPTKGTRPGRRGFSSSPARRAGRTHRTGQRF